jgi:MFS family permease
LRVCDNPQSLNQFVAARAFQAACAALMSPVGNQILFRVTPKHQFVTAVAISTTPALVAPVIGPALGGILITALSWPWIFFLNVPVGLIGIALTLRSIPPMPAGMPRPFDWSGFLLMGSALACLIYGLEEAALADEIWFPIGLIAAGLLLGTLAIRHILRADHPVVSLKAMRVRTFVSTTMTAGGLIRIPFRGTNLILPLMLQGPLGFNAFWAGILLLGYNGGDLALKAVAGRILRRFGFWRCLVFGGMLSAGSTGTLALLSSATPWLVVLMVLTLAGALRSVLFTSIAALNFADVPKEELPDATILGNVAVQVIGAFAVSFAGLLLSGSALLRGGDSGELAMFDYRAALLIMAAIGFGAVLIFWRLPRDTGSEVSGHAG